MQCITIFTYNSGQLLHVLCSCSPIPILKLVPQVQHLTSLGGVSYSLDISFLIFFLIFSSCFTTASFLSLRSGALARGGDDIGGDLFACGGVGTGVRGSGPPRQGHKPLLLHLICNLYYI